MFGKRTRGGICHAMHRFAKANNKYMKNYDKSKESLYLMYLGANNLCGWAMPQKLHVGGFKWKKKNHKFDEDFIKNYDEDTLMKIDVPGDLPFLAERKKIKKYNKLVCNINDKENYVVHIRALKQALNHRLILTLFKKCPLPVFTL